MHIRKTGGFDSNSSVIELFLASKLKMKGLSI